MKCEHCGYISTKEFYKCPYCGLIHQKDDSVLSRTLKIGPSFSIRYRTLLVIIFANFFALSFLLDFYFNFQHGLTLWAYAILATIISIYGLRNSKNRYVSSIENADFAIFSVLLLACFLPRGEVFNQFRQSIPTLVIPIATIIGTVVSFALLFRNRGEQKLRPLWTDFILIVHFVAMLLILIFFLYGKGHPAITNNGQITQEAHFFHNWFVLEGNLGIFSEWLIYIAFTLSTLYLINYNIAMFGHVFDKARGNYGQPD